MSKIRCPGCHGLATIVGDEIERHHQPQLSPIDTIEYGWNEDDGNTATPVTVERRLECGYSGARVRVKR